MKQQETIAVRAERIVKEARHKLATNPNHHHGTDGEVFEYKKVMIGMYFYADGKGEDELVIAVCREGETEGWMPYYISCSFKDGQMVKRGFFQQTWCLDTDFSRHNDLLNEVTDEALSVVA